MSAENVALIRRGYEAWNRGDLDAVLGLLDSTIKWDGYTHIPESGALVGRDEVRQWLERFLEAWDEVAIEVTDLVDRGDQVIAMVRFQALGKGSGVKVEGGVDAHVWTLHRRKAVAVRLVQGTREALEALGLSHQAGQADS